MQALVIASVTQAITDRVGRDGPTRSSRSWRWTPSVPATGEVTMLAAAGVAGGGLARHEPVPLGHPLPTGAPSRFARALGGTPGFPGGALAGWVLGRSGGRALLERHGRRPAVRMPDATAVCIGSTGARDAAGIVDHERWAPAVR